LIPLLAGFFVYYLYCMNRQVGYIAYAYLLVTGIALSCIVISKIPLGSFEEKHEDVIDGTPNPPIITNSFYKGHDGKRLFQSKCAACHNIFKDLTGPRLGTAFYKEPWTDRQQLYKWIRNPEAFMKTNTYTRELKKQYGSVMTAFTDITDDEIEAIVSFITMNDK
jgi:cytochrome c2